LPASSADPERVLLLHGLGGDRRQALGLLAPDFPAIRIAPDLPGHGDHDLKSDQPLTFAAFAAETAALLTSPTGEAAHTLVSPATGSLTSPAAALRGSLSAEAAALLVSPGQPAVDRIPGPAEVVGVSMGAGVALALAAARPDLVRKLVLIRPSWLDQAPPPHLEPFRIIARILTAGGGPDDFRATAVYQRIAADAPAMAQSLLGQFDRPHAVERARVLDEIPLSLPLPSKADYQALDLDVTIIAAPGDPVHPEALARTMQTWIPGARFVLVPRKMPDPTEHQAAVQQAVATALRH
jgi:pimeloyl-ACP methyl ester carboxylesterase